MNLPEVLHEDNTITPLLLLTDVNKLYFTLVNKILITFVNPMITKMKERLEQFLAAENITQAAFADKIHVTRSSITHILSGRNKPGYDFFSGLVRNYPSLNIEWLLTGKGKMYRFDEDRARATESASSVFTAPYSDGNLFSEEEKAEMLERDQDARRLQAAAEKTGIAKKLKKAGLGWHALQPAWRDFFKDPVYRSRYKVIFFLNPEGQDKYNSGWFTVEELLQWIKGKGPIIRN